MKKHLCMALLVLVLAWAPGLVAQNHGGFGLKIGMFTPSDDYLSDWYDSGFTFGVSYLYPLNPSISIEYAVDYFQSDGKDYAYYDEAYDSDVWGDSELNITPFTFTLRYQPCRRGGICPYVGAGIGYYLIEEELDYMVYDTLYDDTYRVVGSDDDEILGVHLVAGFDAPTRSGGAFTGEIRWATGDGDLWGEDVSIDGVTASLGYRFSF